MEKNQYKLCREVLRRLEKAEILKHLIIIGSWCIPFYENYFSGIDYSPSMRTRDIDFLIPRPASFRSKVDLAELLKDLGFILGFKGEHGVMKLEHPDLVIEFLVPELGRGTDKPRPLPQLGFNAQALRFLNFLMSDTITVSIGDVTVVLPHPVNFALHKLIISQRRQNNDKTMKDREAAMKILKALIEKGEIAKIKDAFQSVPRGWRQKIMKGLELANESSIMQLLKD